MAVPFQFLGDRALRRFLGRRFFVAMVVTAGASIVSGAVDYAFALFIQIFLATLGLLGAVSPQISLPAMDRPLVVGAVLAGLGVVRAVFLFAQGFAGGVANEEASSRVREAAIARLLPPDDHNRVPLSDAYFMFSEISSKAAQYLLQFVKFISATPQTLVLGIAMLVLSWKDCLIACALLGLVGILLLRINVYIGQAATLIPQVWSESISALETAGRNWFYIRIKHLHNSERRRLKSLNNEVLSVAVRMRRLSEVSPTIIGMLGIFVIAVLACTRAVLTHTSPSVFLAFLYVFMRFAQSLGESSRAASGLVEFGSYLDRLRAVLPLLPPADAITGDPTGNDVSVWGTIRTPPRPIDAPPRPGLTRPAGLRSPEVTVRDLSFRYGEDAPFILRHFALEVKPGAQLGIVGPSGCGKSTLLGLLLGFIKPVEGAIALDGIAPEKFCADFSEYIGYVGPEPYIITGTMRDNVLFGSRGAYSDEQIWRALDRAALVDVVKQLPAGLDTPIQHHDVALSMGQRQRLALARALVSEPVLLILDEASANLDDATEAAITDSIRALKGTTTTIIVSHKLGIVKHADNIVDLGRSLLDFQPR